MTAQVFGIKYHKQSRDNYAEIKEEREVKLGETKSYLDRVHSVEGTRTPSANTPANISRRSKSVEDGYKYPVSSRRSDGNAAKQ